MPRNLKLAAMAVVAMLAVGASFSSAAQANQFTAAAYPANVTGSPRTTQQLVIGGNRGLTCLKSSFSGSMSAATKELTLVPIYEECEIHVLGNTFGATVAMEGCDFLLTEPAGGKVDLQCPAGKSVVIRIYNNLEGDHEPETEVCRYTISAQTNLGSVTYTNSGSTTFAFANLTGIAVSRTFGTLAACGAASQTATYTGEITLSATSGGPPVKFDVG